LSFYEIRTADDSNISKLFQSTGTAAKDSHGLIWTAEGFREANSSPQNSGIQCRTSDVPYRSLDKWNKWNKCLHLFHQATSTAVDAASISARAGRR
jgi:hypothetical protein